MATRQNAHSFYRKIKADLDNNRLEQEMAFLAQKSDVAEELDRLDAHIKETRHSLKQGGAARAADSIL